jgi:rhomboid protease GluP
MNQETPQTPLEAGPAPRAVRIPLPQSAPYVTYTIIGVTVAMYLLQLATQVLLQYDIPVLFFIKSNPLIRSGQIWRLLTPILLHGSITHIGFNMYALFSLGTNIERYFGHKRFLLLYLLGGFTGNVASFIMTDANSLGASTAIFGLLAAEGVLLFQNRKMFAGSFRSAIGNIIFVAVINLFVIGSLPGIDNWGHIGGLLGGLGFAWFAGPLWEVESDMVGGFRLVDRRSVNDVIIGAVIVLLVFGALAAWGIFMQ